MTKAAAMKWAEPKRNQKINFFAKRFQESQSCPKMNFSMIGFPPSDNRETDSGISDGYGW